MAEHSKGIIPRMTRGLAAQGFSQAVLVVIRFAEVPLLLAFWGVQLYGEWLMVAVIPAYLALGDGGFATAAGREMIMRVAADNRSGALAIFRSTSILLVVASVGIILLSMGMVFFVPLADLLNFQAISPTHLDSIILLLTVHVLINFQTSLLYGGYQCLGRYATGMVFMAFTQLLEFAGLAVAVAFGAGPVEAAWAYLAACIIGFALMRLGLYRIAPWLRYGWQGSSWKEALRLTTPAIASLAFPLGNALNIQGMRLIVGVVLGPGTVPIFTVLRTLSQLAGQPKEIIKRLVLPEMGLAFGMGNKKIFGLLFLRSSQLALWSSIIVCALLGIAGEYILSFWTRGSISMHWGLFTFLLLALIINSLWNTAMQIAASINRHGRIAVMFSVVYGALAFVIAFGATHLFGLVGVGMAILLVEIIMTMYVVPFGCYISGESWNEWIKKVVIPPNVLNIKKQMSDIIK